MVISWQGFACFKIESLDVTLILDPYDSSSGLRNPRLSGDIVIISKDNPLYNNVDAVKGLSVKKPFCIQGAGEYEVKNIYVYGQKAQEQGNPGNFCYIYRMEIEEVNVATLGGLHHVLSNGDLDFLDRVDVLLIPVGGNITINAKTASQLISQIEPRIVIPMHYKIPQSKVHLESLDPFCKEIGICPKEELQKVKIIKKDLPSDQMRIVVLQA